MYAFNFMKAHIIFSKKVSILNLYIICKSSNHDCRKILSNIGLKRKQAIHPQNIALDMYINSVWGKQLAYS